MPNENEQRTCPCFCTRGLTALLQCLVMISWLALSGCANEQAPRPSQGGSNRPVKPVRAPEPRQGIEVAARRVASAIRADDCERLKAANFSGLPNLSESDCERLLAQLRGFRIEESVEYETGAGVDFATKQAPGTMVFVLGKDGTFKWTASLPRERGTTVVGTRSQSNKRLDAVARSAVESFRKDQCDELEDAARGIVPDPVGPRTFCENRKGLRKLLAEDPRARPRRLGANSRFAFYSLLPRPNGPYDTMVLLQEGRRAAFFADYPIPAQRRK